jgi:RimJ/RimL family protein N-acetyltransferase
MTEQDHWNVLQAVSADHTKLLVLWQRFMLEEDRALIDADPQTHIESWSTRLSTQIKQRKVVVIRQDGEIVGFVGLIDHTDKPWVPLGVAYIVDIYMLPHARSFVAFKMLVNGLLKLVGENYHQVWTNIADSNHRVGALLSRLGFTALKNFHVPGLENQSYLMKTIRETDARSGIPAALLGMMSSDACPMFNSAK